MKRPDSAGVIISEQTDTLLTREKLASMLREEGLVLTARTLRYWEMSGKMPRAVRAGRQVYYDQEVIQLARMLAATRPGIVAELRERARITPSGDDRKNLSISINGSMVILTIHPKRLSQ